MQKCSCSLIIASKHHHAAIIFIAFFFNILCINTQIHTIQYINILGFQTSYMTQFLPPMKTFIPVCSFAVFASEEDYLCQGNSGGTCDFPGSKSFIVEI